MRKASVLLLVACFVMLACKFNPNYQGHGTAFLQGVWKQSATPYQDSLISSVKHQFKFTCDSVYITLQTNTKANYYPDSCFNNGSWTEYATGSYVVRNDTLYILSTFTKSNFKQKLSGCYRIGQYLPTFLIKKKNSTEVVMQGLKQHGEITLQLQERTKCIPKPL